MNKYSIHDIYSKLDALPPHKTREITLSDGTRVTVNNMKCATFNRLYNISKATQKCVCVACGTIPDHVVYDSTIKLRLITTNGSFMTLDHIIPKSIGGGSTRDNIQVMCYECNNRKGSMAIQYIPCN